ncbi:MAG: hypothetical protein DRR11_17085 [Gammaproteobacteria bacterium]|nr:MAG: hypothetical protein DRR11_17085 [Gammaproteobacteria bacterium]
MELHGLRQSTYRIAKAKLIVSKQLWTITREYSKFCAGSVEYILSRADIYAAGKLIKTSNKRQDLNRNRQ